MTLKRSITFDILEGAQESLTIGLLGSRQTGKTTLSQLIFKDHAYVSLEDIELRTAATIEPRTFLNANRNASGIIIDNFHYVPELLSYMQPKGNSQKPGTYIVCGPYTSSNLELLNRYLENSYSLYTLQSLSLQELTDNYLLPQSIDSMLYHGLLPEVYLKKEDTKSLYKHFLSNYIDKDVRFYGQVDNVTTFHTFLTYCAHYNGQVLNITTLAHESGISDHTARRWISLLEDHHIIFLLKPYHTDFGKRLIKSPKLYFYDPGLVCSLLKVEEFDIQRHKEKAGLFGSLILGELMKWSQLKDHKLQLYFWRDKTEHEIECLIEYEGRVSPVSLQVGQKSDLFFNAVKYWHKIGGKSEQGMRIFSEPVPSQKEDHLDISWRFMQPLFKAFQS
jgi:predicted AAA+ superfamily ATPase